jgi:hypothetical protein
MKEYYRELIYAKYKGYEAFFFHKTNGYSMKNTLSEVLNNMELANGVVLKI